MLYRSIQLILLFLCIILINCDDPEVEITQGRLLGNTRINRDGGTYYAFKNIPYAKPPVGELRFKAPAAADGWEGIRDATGELPKCRQLSDEDLGQEDCLYLNIYTPGLPSENITGKAVMVWIYGGGYVNGHAQESNWDPQYFLIKDVVFVIFNYRLGLFGFLTLDDSNLGITGNAGLKDQAFALQWIQDNIAYFGGDPNNVLLFGESAGSMSTHLQILSPMSTGLFRKAISQSGVGPTPPYFGTMRNTAILVAEHLGIQTVNWEDMLAVLQELPADEIHQAEMMLSTTYPYITGPIVEIVSVEPTFLERDPYEVIESGDFNQVSYINGFNDAEGLMLIWGDENGVGPLIPDITAYIPQDLEIQSGSEEEEDVVQRIKDFYYEGRVSSRDNITGDVNFYTDYAFAYPLFRVSTGQLPTSENPMYIYYFSALTQLNGKHDIQEMSEYPGANHADELWYLFHASWKPVEDGSIEETISRDMVDLWTNFAIFGDPTADGFDFIWEPMQKDQFNYLHIRTDGYYPEVDLLPYNMKFWTDIYEDYYQRKS